MRRAARTDGNHTSVVDALRKSGCLVISLASVGKGCPDLLACDPWGRLHLIEVKDGNAPASQRELTKDQEKFHAVWVRSSFLHVVTSGAEAVACVRNAET